LEAPRFEDLTYREEIQPGNIHREEWTWDGVLHSIDDHPSVIIDGGRETQWHSYGMRHRIGGPAWIKDFGNTVIYYNLGYIHRTDGPAMITETDEKWYFNDKLHREDGPAVIRNRDTGVPYEWWWRHRQYSDIDVWAEHAQIDPQLFLLIKLEYG